MISSSILDAMDSGRIPYKVVDGKLRVGRDYKCELTDAQRISLASALADEGEFHCAECRGLIRPGRAVVDVPSGSWRHLWCQDKLNGNTVHCDATRAAEMYFDYLPLLTRTDLPGAPVAILPHLTITPSQYVAAARPRLKALAHRATPMMNELNQIETVLNALHTHYEEDDNT